MSSDDATVESDDATGDDSETPKDAWEEDECLLCAPAPHANCEVYGIVQMLDPSQVPLGEDHADHLVSVPVCLEHYQAFAQFRGGREVADVRV